MRVSTEIELGLIFVVGFLLDEVVTEGDDFDVREVMKMYMTQIIKDFS